MRSKQCSWRESDMKISNDGTRVTFVSKEPWYTRERLGFKRNTVRPGMEGRLEYEKLVSSLYKLKEIEVKDAATNQSFVRLLTDVSYYDDTFIFSWQHPGERANRISLYLADENIFETYEALCNIPFTRSSIGECEPATKREYGIESLIEQLKVLIDEDEE